MAETDAPEHGGKGFLSGQVTIPGTKAKVPKAAAAAGIALVAIFAIMYYRNRKAKTATAAAGTTVTDPDGNVCAALAPSGYCPGTPNDVAYQASTSGTSGGGFGGGGSGGGIIGTPVPTQVTTGPPFTSNAAWSQYVIGLLSTPTGSFDPGTVTNAIGAYIDGVQVTTAQETIINDAIAIGGTPPVAGTNGFPPSINVGGSKDHQGPKPTRPSALVLRAAGTTVEASWHPGRNASSYEFQITPKDPSPHDIGDRTEYSAGGLEPGKDYTVHVAAKNAQGTSAFITKTIKTPAREPVLIPGGPRR